MEPMLLATVTNAQTEKVGFDFECLTFDKNQIDFMLKYMEEKFGERACRGDKGNLANMRSEVSRLEAALVKQKEKTQGSTADE